jgi:hypothetical protein
MRHRADRHAGLAGVWMPEALERKYPNAGSELGWFRVFPSQTLSTDARAGVVRRHDLSESVIQKLDMLQGRMGPHPSHDPR